MPIYRASCVPKTFVFNCFFENVEISTFLTIYNEFCVFKNIHFSVYLNRNAKIFASNVQIFLRIRSKLSVFCYNLYFFILCCKFCLTIPKSLAVFDTLPSLATRCCCITVFSIFSKYSVRVVFSLLKSATFDDVAL